MLARCAGKWGKRRAYIMSDSECMKGMPSQSATCVHAVQASVASAGAHGGEGACPFLEARLELAAHNASILYLKLVSLAMAVRPRCLYPVGLPTGHMMIIKEEPLSTLLIFLVDPSDRVSVVNLRLFVPGMERRSERNAFTLSHALTTPRCADVGICVFTRRQT